MNKKIVSLVETLDELIHVLRRWKRGEVPKDDPSLELDTLFVFEGLKVEDVRLGMSTKEFLHRVITAEDDDEDI